VLGPENADTLASRGLLAKILIQEGKYEEAEKLARQVYEIQVRVLGPQHLDSLSTLQTLGTALVHTGRYDDAKQLFTDAIEKVSKTQQSNVAMAWIKFAYVAVAAHDADGAIQDIREAINNGYKEVERIRTDDDLQSLRADPRFGALLADAEKRTEGDPQHH
jgi:tetratricopeptide (TPR) repeat protein